jgi:predicted DsbA family dithiol-disulfide isomerase
MPRDGKDDGSPVVATGMKVEIWSDVVCPWCHIGKRNLEAALAGFDHADEVEVVWRSFELDPSAPAEHEGDYAERLARKYGVPVDQARAMTDRMTETAAAAGLTFRFDLARPGNTFDAHRVIHLAGRHGVQDRVKERLLTATFAEGEPIGHHETLVRLAGEAGLDAEQVRGVLASDAYADEVRADERRAAEYGISGVPFFVVDGRYGASGAQPPDALRALLERAWEESHARPVLVTLGDHGDGCDDEGCAL